MIAETAPLSLVADVGGTNTRVALAEGRRLKQGSIRRYANGDHPGLENVLRRYLAEEDAPQVQAACVAVAGPVQGGRARLTNLDWEMDLGGIARATGAEVTDLLNDLQAQGHALGHLEAASIRTLLPFPDHPRDATRLVIGVGTGFNIAPVFITGRHRLVPPAEAGHVNLPIRTEDDARLAAYVTAKLGFASVEEVLSGRGFEQVHAWARSEAVSGAVSGAGARGVTATTGEILEAFRTGTDPVARRTVEVFARMLGSVAGNLALTTLPFGGIYLIGGVARGVAPHLLDCGFAEAFRDKGRFSDFMQGFGLGVIEDDFAALVGCAAHLVGLMD
ncbi:MAG: glucokinase [Rubellimicrobium sp.]|nr:glucokinase [Rubellimicrobium sp.]